MGWKEKILQRRNNKTFLNAIITPLAALVVLSSSISVVLSNLEDSCSNEVSVMLLNKTQMLVEKQPILFDRTWSIIGRGFSEMKGDNSSQEGFQGMIGNSYVQYQNFLKIELKNYDEEIINKQQECSSHKSRKSGALVVTVILASLQLILSTIYLKKYTS